MNNIRRFFLTVFAAFFVCLSPAFSHGGVLSDSSSPLYVITTEYFDIIFPAECRESAEKIEAVCDGYYLEITGLLETEPYQRFPVTITRSVDVLNAYYAAVPYNRIVLYDTLPEETLGVFEKTIQSVFYHELTHAVTYNMKSEKLKKYSFISDALTPAWFTITTFWAEGATVSFESMTQGGRLNDPFSTQLVNQAKIEGRFPSWRDVTGSRDTYPGGTDAYIFGSMFTSYLQKTYGMSKYADFWKNAGSKCPASLIAGIFKITYGISVTEAWNDFEKTLLIESGEKSGECVSHKKSRISAADMFYDAESGETKIAYFDNGASSLRLITLSQDGKIKKNKKLLAVTGITRVVFSPDGKKLALSRNVERKNSKSVLAEFDLKRKKYTEYKLTSLKEGYFRINEDREELASVRIDGCKAGGNAAVLLNENEIPSSPVALDKNLYAAIIKDGLKWKIRLFDSKKVVAEYDLQGKILHKLHLASAGDDSILLSFTWAELGKGGQMLSRAGFLKIDRKSLNAQAFFQKENLFAGLLEVLPSKEAAEVFCRADETESESSFQIFAVAAEYDKKPLYRIEMKNSDFEKTEIENSSAETEKPEPLPSATQNLSSFPESAYSPLEFYRRGIFVPLLGTVPVYNHDFEQDSSTVFGLTFVSTNPWGDRQITFASGYDMIFNKGGAQLGISGGNNSFSYVLDGTCMFDENGFFQTFDSLQVSKTLWSGKVSDLSSGVKGNFLYGKQIVDDDLEAGRDDSVGKSADGIAFLQFSSVHKVSPVLYKNAGFIFQPFVLTSYRDTEKRPEPDEYINAGASLVLKAPLFFPFTFTASIFPSSKYSASGSAKAILYDFEIQKGVPAITIFLRRMLFTASYEGKFSYVHGKCWDIRHSEEIFRNTKKDDYSDAVKLGGELQFCINTGMVATSASTISLGYAFIYRPNPKPSENSTGFALSLKLDNGL